MTTITIINAGEPNNPQHIGLLGGEELEGVEMESVDITDEQIERNIEDSADILAHLASLAY